MNNTHTPNGEEKTKMETKMTDGKTSQVKVWNCGHTEDEHSFADTMFCVRKKTTSQRLSAIASEMKLRFDRWDRSKKDGFEPVAIQDLDFWLSEIKDIIAGGQD